MSDAPETPSTSQTNTVEKSSAEQESRTSENNTPTPENGQPSTSKSLEQERDVTNDESKPTPKEATEAGEGTEDDANPPLPDEPEPTQSEWQAIWSPSHNAYYFYNSRTAETTWVNPLDPSSSASASGPVPPEPQAKVPAEKNDEPVEQPPQDLSYLNGIDPELAYLDPTLAVPSTTAKGPVPTFSARFGARSGKFTAMDGRRPEHLSEAARAQRMGAVYYDTEAWEKEIAERDAKAKADEAAGVGDKRKRLTKADIERFKEQKKAKKALRNAWLHD